MSVRRHPARRHPARRHPAHRHPAHRDPAGPGVPARSAGARNDAPGTARADRGSGAVITVFFAVVVLGLAAFIVDGGMAIAQRERAMDIAEQAARYAAQDLDEEALRSGAAVGINFDNCDARVTEFVGAIRLTSASVAHRNCEREAEDAVTVYVVVTYRPVFAGVLFNTLTTEGRATAYADTGAPPAP
ncbi:TadE/TadG family type IV pilus assembly protein [Streptomyces sp. ST2-7A]|uniref:TadE/TadG family type IV pilus assembly protein n=1 Tax=Streptomyces sp. ST2-7A TaxID=2907214 RepID=UPI001F217E91|nr:pilus assembly protein TadG-related protein [Streptomyces sp. ST2-7A]MCE7080605.1 pilus assembly protein TadG-related protein [Streptomyces sp. ST2-7A]